MSPAAVIFNERRESVAVFSNQPDSLRTGGVRCAANAANSVVTAFPDAHGRSHNPCQGGTCLSMLPGFRFLFAAIVLSMSILVFGLGAAALLRAAHEQFANNSSWRGAPEAMFAQRAETTSPVLALLRVDPAAAGQKRPDDVPAAATPVEQYTALSTPAEQAPAAARADRGVRERIVLDLAQPTLVHGPRGAQLADVAAPATREEDLRVLPAQQPP